MKRTCIFVLGMHRSGTSAMAGALSSCGVFPGENLYEARAENPKGYFESRNVVKFNDSMLATLGYSWDNVMFKPEDVIELSDDITNQTSLKSIINNTYSNNEYYLIKDPRVSILLPLYIKVMLDFGDDICIVVMNRSTGAIIKSLKARSNQKHPYTLSDEMSVKLINIYNDYIAYYLDTYKYKRYLVTYDHFVHNPVEDLQKLSDELILNLNINKNSVESFISPLLNHHPVNQK